MDYINQYSIILQYVKTSYNIRFTYDVTTYNMYLHVGNSDVIFLTFLCQLAANKCHDTINSMISSPSLISLVLCLLFFAVLMFHGPELAFMLS